MIETPDLRSSTLISPSIRSSGREIIFHAPGLKRFRTFEYDSHCANEFVPISLTGVACALNCEHCQTTLLRSMHDLPARGGSLFELCSELQQRGARGVLVSGGSDRQGRVPLYRHLSDLVRVRRELGLTVRVHPGLPDEKTCTALAQVGIDGAMVDVIGHTDTIRQVYHLDATPDDYERVLGRMEQYHLPTIPHIILGLHFGRMLGERTALEMIARHSPKVLVLVILTPLSGTAMAGVTPPSLAEIGEFFDAARRALSAAPVMLGCARPLGPIKADIDRLAVDAGLDGIAYPAEGTVAYARAAGRVPRFVNACCGVTW